MRIKGISVVAVLLILLAPTACLAIEVADAVVCRDVQDREPVEAGDSFPADIGKVWCWSKITDGKGATIKHVYHYEGREMAVVELDIRSPLFRTYSSKKILAPWTGQWGVDIIDEEGNVLKALEFRIVSEPEMAE